jgi:hypothetical protein
MEPIVLGWLLLKDKGKLGNVGKVSKRGQKA